LILAGRVCVNGQQVWGPGVSVGADDVVLFDGVPVQPEQTLRYLALHKPEGFLCSQCDPQNRPLAKDLLPKHFRERLYNVGRLDFLSCGLIFFTNDGEFARALSHPSSRIEKEYFVQATGDIPAALFEQFARGITIEGVHYRANRIMPHGRRAARVCLIEGKNREIRRVFSHFHVHPRLLKRVRIGRVNLDDLACGHTRELTQKEVLSLMRASSCQLPVAGSR
jgi:23S rRNA pseudouridine2605 synthase